MLRQEREIFSQLFFDKIGERKREAKEGMNAFLEKRKAQF